MNAEPTTIEFAKPPEWITSDTHLGHERILELCPDRKLWGCEGGITTVQQHDDLILNTTNRIVGLGHTLLHLGDFAFGSAEHVRECVRRLPFNLAIVVGNHDRSMTSLRDACAVDRVGRRAKFWYPGLGNVVCRHRPKDFTKEDVEWADVLLHGHCHGNAAHHSDDEVVDGVLSRMFDVGVDVLGPGPIPMYLLPQLVRARRERRSL